MGALDGTPCFTNGPKPGVSFLILHITILSLRRTF